MTGQIFGRPREAEIQHLHVPIFCDEHIVWFEVSVYQSPRVRRRQPFSGLDEHFQNSPGGAVLVFEPALQRSPIDELHGDKNLFAQRADVVYGDDVGMGQARHRLRFPKQSLSRAFLFRPFRWIAPPPSLLRTMYRPRAEPRMETPASSSDGSRCSTWVLFALATSVSVAIFSAGCDEARCPPRISAPERSASIRFQRSGSISPLGDAPTGKSPSTGRVLCQMRRRRCAERAPPEKLGARQHRATSSCGDCV